MLCLMVQSDKMKRKRILIPVNPGGGGGGAGPPKIENRCEGSQVRCDCVAWLSGCSKEGPGVGGYLACLPGYKYRGLQV